MAIFYNKVQRINPSDREAPAKWYPVLRTLLGDWGSLYLTLSSTGSEYFVARPLHILLQLGNSPCVVARLLNRSRASIWQVVGQV